MAQVIFFQENTVCILYFQQTCKFNIYFSKDHYIAVFPINNFTGIAISYYFILKLLLLRCSWFSCLDFAYETISLSAFKACHTDMQKNSTTCASWRVGMYLFSAEMHGGQFLRKHVCPQQCLSLYLFPEMLHMH